MGENIAVICRVDDLLTSSEIEVFLKQLPGCKLIYFAHSTKKLFVVDSDRFQRVEASIKGGDAHE